MMGESGVIHFAAIKGSGDTPLIGLCATLERARFGAWDRDTILLPRTYVNAVQRAGGIAIVLPPDPVVAEDPDRVLDVIDGLILAGGRDVDPSTYGAERERETDEPRTERDVFEIALARRAMERDLPLLGICRGMQVLNVASGGTLEQHLPERIGSEAHRHTPGTFSDHAVRIAPGSLTSRVVGGESAEVMSHHHQGVAELGEGVEASGWSEGDDVIEAIELPERRFALGVLWHPEEDERSRVIGALVEEARGRSSSP
jgi:putative glutamine amidotransferase